MINVFKVNIWDVLCYFWRKCQLEIGFAFGLTSKPRFLGLDSKTSFKAFSYGDSHLVGNSKDCDQPIKNGVHIYTQSIGPFILKPKWSSMVDFHYVV